MQEGAGSDDSGRGGPTSPGGPGAAGSPVELALAGLDASDGRCLLLRAPDGTTFRLRADSALRSAMRTLGPATGALAPTPVPLRPREIQARIRAGESAADVAADAGVPVEAVRRYEGPVLAERAHVAERARAARVRADGDRLRLIDVVKVRLGARGVDVATVVWDAWRRDEARWSVVAAFRVGGRDKHAQWLFDPRSQALEPMDDEARWLCAVQDAAPRTGRRLAAVRVYGAPDDGALDGPPDSSLDGTDEGLDEVAVPEPADPAEIAARTMELLDALRDRRGRRVPVMDLDGDESWGEDDEDEYLNALLDLPPAAHPPASLTSPPGAGAGPGADDEGARPAADTPRLRMLRAAITGEIPVTGGGDASGGIHASAGVEDEGDEGPDESDPRPEGGDGTGAIPAQQPTTRRQARRVHAAPVPAPGPAPSPASGPVAGPVVAAGTGEQEDEEDDAPAGRSRRRPSVPSWDEILFGSPRLD